MNGDLVITGAGLVTPFGSGVPAFWDGLLSGGSALQPAHSASFEAYDKAPVGEVPHGTLGPDGDRKRGYAQTALAEALAASGRERLPDGTLLVLAGQAPARGAPETGPAEVLGPPASAATPFTTTGTSAGLRVVHVSHACASALFAVGFARSVLRAAEAPLAVVVASSALNSYEYSSMDIVKAISETAATPFDVRRSGISLGEGGGALVLEPAASTAERRGPVVAGLTCRVTGGKAAASDPAVIASGMWDAMDDASVGKLDHVHAHATGTPQGDAAELTALDSLARDSAVDRLPVTSHKGAIGHLLHASGVPALVAAAMTLRTGVVPPAAGLGSPETTQRAQLATAPLSVPGVRTCAVNCLGFGGSNATVVLRGPESA